MTLNHMFIVSRGDKPNNYSTLTACLLLFNIFIIIIGN